MPTNRTRRRRTPAEPDVIAALKSGADVQYSPENWALLIAGYYFGEYDLTADEKSRAAALLDQWRELQFAHESSGRR